MLQKHWYKSYKTWLVILLLPLSYLFLCIVKIRKILLQKKAYKSKAPLIVVGNITIGGTGKTPLVQELYKYLKTQGYKPAIITRGYTGKSKQYPFIINKNTALQECGDEPFMLYWTLKDAHIIVSPDRVKAIKYIEQDLSMIDVIISDDGLQHYAMFHDIEIAVIDGDRNFGNSLCLPAGPLREPVKRLNTVDLIIINGANNLNSAENVFSMKIIPQKLINLQTKKSYTIDEFISLKGSFCYAVAAIGNTNRFFFNS